MAIHACIFAVLEELVVTKEKGRTVRTKNAAIPRQASTSVPSLTPEGNGIAA